MNRATEEFRAKVARLSDAELVKRHYLLGLVARVDAEMVAMKTLFGSGEERLEPPPDTRVTGLQHLFQQEIVRRQSAAQANTPTKILHTEGEENDRGNTNGNAH